MRVTRMWTVVPAAAVAGLMGLGTAASATAAPMVTNEVSDAAVERDPATTPHVGMSVKPSRDGVAVARVQSDGPADQAGIESGDVLVSVAGVELNERGALRTAYSALEVGDTVDVVVDRDGEEITLSLTVGSKADLPGLEERVWFGASPERPDRDELSDRADDGSKPEIPLIIGEVTEGSPAEAAGLGVGDEILTANGVEITSIRQGLSLLREAEPGDTVVLTVDRNGQEITLVVVLASQADNPNFEEERAERKEQRKERREEIRERIQERRQQAAENSQDA